MLTELLSPTLLEATTRIAFFLVLFVSLPLALWKGGEPERYGAFVILAMIAAQVVGRALLPIHFNQLDAVSFVTDLIGALGFGYLAMQALRIWPLWAASLQLLALSAHFARWASIKTPEVVYALMRGGPTFLVLLALLVGTVLHLRRCRKHGNDPSWQDWSRILAQPGR